MKNQKNPLIQMITILSSLTCLVIIGTFIEVKSNDHQKVLAEAESIAKAESESIAEVQNQEKEEEERTLSENMIKKAPLRDKYVEQFLKNNGSDSAYWHIEVINRIYPVLEYIEIGDQIQLVFTPEADAQLTDSDLGRLWGSELKGYYDDVYNNLTIEDLNEYKKDFNTDDSDDSDDSDAGYSNSPGYHTVEGHYRTNSDGNTTYVDGYTRSNPDGDLSNNLSSPD